MSVSLQGKNDSRKAQDKSLLWKFEGELDITFSGYDPETKETNILRIKDIPYSVKIRGERESSLELSVEANLPSSLKNKALGEGGPGASYRRQRGSDLCNLSRARYYDPEVGRFISRDPIPGYLGVPLTLNLYVYVENNPIRWVDPLGLKSCKECREEYKNCIRRVQLWYAQKIAGIESHYYGIVEICIDIFAAQFWNPAAVLEYMMCIRHALEWMTSQMEIALAYAELRELDCKIALEKCSKDCCKQ